jgi:hypothetical protein
MKREDIPGLDVQGFELTRDVLEDMIDWLADRPASKRGDMPGIKPDRGDVILGGALVLATALDTGGFDRIEVTEAGLREGVFFDRLLGDRELFDDVRRESVLNLGHRFTAEQGHELDGYMIRPPDFDENNTYPLVLMIYGGPSSQGVYNEFETNAWTQYLAQQGYLIANVNNRGNGGYGRDFEKSVYLNLGKKEAEDFAAAAKYLASYNWIDGNRMAIRGHSYGGYIAALTMVLHPRVFRAGLVAAPVTDWRLYDTIYTERYMGLLEENEEN